MVDINDLALIGQDGVTFDGGFGTSNNAGVALQMSLFFVSFFMDWESSKCLEHKW